MDLKTLDILLMLAGVVYGVGLILSAFIKNKITEAFRIDALFMPKPNLASRMINIPAGIFVLGYSVYSLLKSLK